MTIVFHGEPGAYGDQAARAFASGARTAGRPSLSHVFEAVAGGEAERGVVPTENSITGSVDAVLDGLLAHRGLRVVGERWQRVACPLLAPKGIDADQLREIRSSASVLAQCADTLGERFPQVDLVATDEAASTARQVAAEKPANTAAIASVGAGELYGLAVLDADVADRMNVTRFLLLAAEGAEAERGEAMKTTLALTPRAEVPNALFRSLTAFVGRRLRVWKVEPRPQRGVPASYHYLVDVEGDAGAEPLASALADLTALNDDVRVLGSYAAGALPT